MTKSIIITGASSGLGRSLAREYVGQGHQVFGCGRRSEVNLQGMVYRSVDLADPGMLDSWVEGILIETAQIDLCVNCAGSLVSGKSLWDFDVKEAQSMLDTNVVGLLNLLRQIIPVMKKNGSGTFITMASNPAGYPLAGLGLYALCKTSVEKLIAVLGEELPRGVLAIALYPGLVNTPMLQRSIGTNDAGAYPMPEEWARQAATALLDIDEKYQGLHISLEEIICSPHV